MKSITVSELDQRFRAEGVEDYSANAQIVILTLGREKDMDLDYDDIQRLWAMWDKAYNQCPRGVPDST